MMPEPPGTHCPGPVEDIVARLEDAARGRARVTLGDVMAAFGPAAFLPLLMVPALLVFSPLSGIPLLPTVCGLLIALIAAQMLVPGRQTLWLPDRLMRLRLRGDRARRAAGWLGRVARWLDQRARVRFGLLVSGFQGRVFVASCCMVCGLAMPFLELVPFSSSLLALAVLLLATGLLTGDGLFALAGLAIMGLAALVPLLALGAVLGDAPGV
jgi:hypothetical protein